MQQTPNYQLQLYEADDFGNLLDGYNASMETLDIAIKQVEENAEDHFPVNTADIENGAVTSSKLASEAVTLNKLASSAFDESPTLGSDKLVSSNGVYTAIQKRQTPVIVLIGDSWSALDTGSWVPYFEQMFPCDLHNYAKGKNGYVTTTQNSNFGTQVARAIEDESFANADVDYVIFFGSINDSNQSGLYQAAKTAITTAKSAFTNATVFVIGEQNIAPYPLATYQNGSMQVKLAATECDVQFVDASLWGFQTAGLYDSTNSHLTQTGYKMVAKNVLALFDGTQQHTSAKLNLNIAMNSYLKPINANYVQTSITETGSINGHITFAWVIGSTDPIPLAEFYLPDNYYLPGPIPVYPADNTITGADIFKLMGVVKFIYERLDSGTIKVTPTAYPVAAVTAQAQRFSEIQFCIPAAGYYMAKAT